MLRSVSTIPRPPAGMVVGLLAERSKPADRIDPFFGRVASSDSFLTKSGGSSDDDMLRKLFWLEEEERSNTEVESDEKMLL